MYEIPQLSRRSFIRSTTIAGIGVAVLGLAGCAPKKPAASEGAARAYTAGTYTASSQGKFGPVTIQATFSNEAIENIEVTDHEETAFISDRALTELPEAIVENQSLAVDTITGATLSSMAVLAATEDCVRQAGGNPSDLKEAPQKTASTGTESLEADLLVVGAGGSGMACAIAAAKLGMERIVVLEKSCSIGGNALVSGGYLEYVEADDSLREEMTDSQRAQLEADLAAAEGVVPAEALELIRGQWANWQAAGNTKCFDSIELQALQYTIAGEATTRATCCSARTSPPWTPGLWKTASRSRSSSASSAIRGLAGPRPPRAAAARATSSIIKDLWRTRRYLLRFC